jgi:hypothetical protein
LISRSPSDAIQGEEVKVGAANPFEKWPYIVFRSLTVVISCPLHLVPRLYSEIIQELGRRI